ncbi:hypothetical protein [Nocardioides convexus]|uniref:hypothetical protein n=1 Tax=Nocardioides convexus TaxID=2712224 RepID=UPI002418870F|nr:hypothetical protein [Nocardioides convexus]
MPPQEPDVLRRAAAGLPHQPATSAGWGSGRRSRGGTSSAPRSGPSPTRRSSPPA